MSRNRTRTLTGTVNGTIVKDYGPGSRYEPETTSQYPVIDVFESCDDSTGRGVDHALYIRRRRAHTTPVTGKYTSPDGISWTFNNWRPGAYGDAGSYAGAVELPPYDLNVLRAQLLSRSNPSRADADLTVTIGELRTLPRDVLNNARDFMREALRSQSLRRLARSGALPHRRNPLQEGAGAYLGVQFGLLPLISDVKDIMNYQQLVGNRLKELNNLRDGNGLRRKINLGFTQAKGEDRLIGISSDASLVLDGGWKTYASRRIWGTVRWRPDGTVKTPDTDRRRVMEARRAVYGLNADLSSAYNLMPWSWLLDYFSNVGDVIDATRNSVGARPGNTNIMVHTIQAGVITPVPRKGLSGGGRIDVRETKERIVASGFTGHFSSSPILTNKQVSILGSLAVSRLPRRGR